MPDLAHSAAFMLYPRGFFGAQYAPSIKKSPRPFATAVNRLQNNLSLLRGMTSGDQIVVNENIELLYGKMISEVVTFNNFEFREKVLNAALSAFGTNSFDFWYTQQRYSPSSGELHRAFLADTLDFIENGTRNQHLETWNVLVSFGDRGERTSVIDEKAAEFFGLSSNGIGRIRRQNNSDLVDVIQQWVSHPGGFADLLFTLHILFGML